MTGRSNPFGSLSTETAPSNTAALSKLELTSVHALMAYAAYQRNISEEMIAKNLTHYFGVQDITQLPSKSFDEVIKFLVDIQIDMLLH